MKLLGKNAAREKRTGEKNIVRNEGTEKKFPEHKDSIKKISFLQEITNPPNQKLNGRPLIITRTMGVANTCQFRLFTSKSQNRYN